MPKPAEEKKAKKTEKKAEKTKKSSKVKKVAKTRKPAVREQQYVSNDSQAAAALSNMVVQNLIGGAMQYGMAKQRMKHHRREGGEMVGHRPRKQRKQPMMTGNPTFTGYTINQDF